MFCPEFKIIFSSSSAFGVSIMSLLLQELVPTEPAGELILESMPWVTFYLIIFLNLSWIMSPIVDSTSFVTSFLWRASLSIYLFFKFLVSIISFSNWFFPTTYKKQMLFKSGIPCWTFWIRVLFLLAIPVV